MCFSEGFQLQRGAADSSTIQVSWQKGAHLGGNSLKDELMVISAAGGKYSEIKGTGILRMNLGGSFELPASLMPLAPGSLPIYLFFDSKDGRNYSESVCLEV